MGWIGCIRCEKNPTRLRGTNFCTSSARYPPSFVWQPNGPGCTQIVQNAWKRQFGPNGVDRVHSLRKIPTQVRGTNFWISSACFALSFVRQPNGPECTQIVRNAPECQFRVQCGGSDAFVAKNSDATCGTNFYTCSAHFASSFVRQPNSLECTQIVRTHQMSV